MGGDLDFPKKDGMEKYGIFLNYFNKKKKHASKLSAFHPT